MLRFLCCRRQRTRNDTQAVEDNDRVRPVHIVPSVRQASQARKHMSIQAHLLEPNEQLERPPPQYQDTSRRVITPPIKQEFSRDVKGSPSSAAVQHSKPTRQDVVPGGSISANPIRASTEQDGSKPRAITPPIKQESGKDAKGVPSSIASQPRTPPRQDAGLGDSIAARPIRAYTEPDDSKPKYTVAAPVPLWIELQLENKSAYIYRVQCPGAVTTFDQYSGLRALGARQTFNTDSDFRQMIGNQLSWYSRTPTPFISGFDNLSHATNWARKWSGNHGGEACDVLTIDTGKAKSPVYKVTQLVEKLDIPVPNSARGRYSDEYYFLGAVPITAIVHRESVRNSYRN